MKHLKTYKVFESVWAVWKEDPSDREIGEAAKQDLDDVLIYLKDQGYKSEVKFFMDYHAELSILITDYQGKKIKWDDIKDDVERAMEVVSDRFIPTEVFYKELQSDGRVFNRNQREETSWPRFLDLVNSKDYDGLDRKFIFLAINLTQILNRKSVNLYESKEVKDDSDTMARYQLFEADTKMAFDFNRQLVVDPEQIKELIKIYNETYNKTGEWGGGPVNGEFIKQYNKRLVNNVLDIYDDGEQTSKIVGHNPRYPMISLIIENPDYGNIELGYSLKDKKCKSINLTRCHIPHGSSNIAYDQKVSNQIHSFVRNNIYNKQLTIDETINTLQLRVDNRIEWEWVYRPGDRPLNKKNEANEDSDKIKDLYDKEKEAHLHKRPIKRRMRIKRLTNGGNEHGSGYNWTPSFNDASPAPPSNNISIRQVSI
jgi:hypothetical protein